MKGVQTVNTKYGMTRDKHKITIFKDNFKVSVNIITPGEKKYTEYAKKWPEYMVNLAVKKIYGKNFYFTLNNRPNLYGDILLDMSKTKLTKDYLVTTDMSYAIKLLPTKKQWESSPQDNYNEYKKMCVTNE